MFVTTHVLAGALIGRTMARHPVGAFMAGVVSHFVMDCCPHYGDESMSVDDPEFIRIARCDGCAGLAAMALGAGLAPKRSRRAVVAGMVGGAIVDTDKPFEHFIGWNPWPAWWNRFHKRIQNQDPERMRAELVTIALLALAAWKLLPDRLTQ